MNKGILVVVSGFSGAGKGTVMKRLMEKYDDYALSVSATTRKPRPGEEDGREYFFRTRDEFEKLIEEDALLEYAQYVENYYGTPRSYVEEQLQAGRNVILEIEIQGAMKIKEKIPEALLVFVTPPTVEELERRLTGRGTETAQVIADRLARAGEEAEGMGQYDYILVNDTVEECVDHLHQIIVSEHSRASRNAEFIALKAAKNNGTIISYDPNYRASLWDSQEEACKWMRSILEYADIVKVSEEEIELLTGYTDVRKAAESITEYGAKIVLITLGEKGSFVYLQDQQEAYVSGYSSKVVDTTGAGDSFMGGFLYKICESGKHIEEYSLQEMIECVRFGNAVASLCVEREGAIPAMPVMEEVIKRINN